MDVMGLAQVIKINFGKKYKLPLMKAPKVILYLVGGLFGVTPKFVARNVGHDILLNTSKSKDKLGLKYHNFDNTVKDMVNQMHEQKIV